MLSTQRPEQSIEGTLRSLRMIHAVLLTSMLLYVWLAEKIVPHQERTLNPTIVRGFVVNCVAMIGVASIVRAKMVRPTLEALQLKPGDASALARWRSGCVTSDVLAEAVVLTGFALRYMGGTFAEALPYYLVGPALMLLWWPRRP